MIGKPECVWPLEGTLLEGPTWVARDAALWFVDIKQHKVHRFDPATAARRTIEAPDAVSFVLPAAGGGFVAGFPDGLHRLDPVTGRFDRHAEVEPDLPGNRLNDGVVDRAGRLWFGTMDNAEAAESGRLYRLGGDGVPVAAGPGCTITNGPAFSPDGRTCYFVDTLADTVWAYKVGDEGILSDPHVFCTIEEGAGHPDGPSVDADGNVWIALFGGWSARRYTPAGTLAETVRFPVKNITKIGFGGPDLKTAYATTARLWLEPDEIEAQPLAGGLFAFSIDVAGLPALEMEHGL